MIETPTIVQTTDLPMAYVHLTVPRDQIQTVMGPGLQEVMAAIASQGATPAGPWFTHHLRMDPAVFDFEICVPVLAPFSASGRVKPGHWPAMKVIRTVYQGPFEGLGGAWGEFDAWIAANGYHAAGDLWERYLVGPETTQDPEAWRTELNRQVIG